MVQTISKLMKQFLKLAFSVMEGKLLKPSVRAFEISPAIEMCCLGVCLISPRWRRSLNVVVFFIGGETRSNTGIQRLSKYSSLKNTRVVGPTPKLVQLR